MPEGTKIASGRARLRALFGAIAAVVFAWPGVAVAEWKTAQSVTIGTAQVLEQGALTFGVVSPIAYGVTDRFTIQSHPVLALLLVPNVAGRYRLEEARTWVLSGAASYKQSFFGSAALSEQARSSPGEITAGPIATWYPERRLGLTLGSAYHVRLGLPAEDSCVAARAIDGRSCSTTGHGVSGTIELHGLLTESDLLMATALGRWDMSRQSVDTPTYTVAWLHDFGRFHLLAGVSVGEFMMGELVGETSVSRWTVFPVLDLWWRL